MSPAPTSTTAPSPPPTAARARRVRRPPAAYWEHSSLPLTVPTRAGDQRIAGEQYPRRRPWLVQCPTAKVRLTDHGRTANGFGRRSGQSSRPLRAAARQTRSRTACERWLSLVPGVALYRFQLGAIQSHALPASSPTTSRAYSRRRATAIREGVKGIQKLPSTIAAQTPAIADDNGDANDLRPAAAVGAARAEAPPAPAALV